MARVPPKVSVPEEVIGPPDKVRPVDPPLPLTEVTEPELPAATVVQVGGAPDPLLVRT